MGKRIIFTGGSGKAGRHAVAYLVAQGHTVLNLDLKPLDIEGVNTLITDLTDSGRCSMRSPYTLVLRALKPARARPRSTQWSISRPFPAC